APTPCSCPAPRRALVSGHAPHPTATLFSADQGYGWQSGTIDSRDRSIGSDLTRDFNFTTDGTFVVNLANGTHDVTITMGDALYPHDQMGVFLQGTQVDSVTTAAGSFSITTYRVTVSGGQLILRLKDLGGSDANVVINTLTIASVIDGDLTLTNNNSLTVNENSTANIITSANLFVSDGSDPASSLVYTLTRAPAQGTLRNNGSALSL